MKDGYLGHIHIKDVQVDTPRATLAVRRMGEGQLADQFQPIADALRRDGYDGVISFESVYHPGNGDFEVRPWNCMDGAAGDHAALHAQSAPSRHLPTGDSDGPHGARGAARGVS